MEALVGLAVLACPVMMVLMMWFMGKGMGGRRSSESSPSSLADLRAEHERLGRQLEEADAGSREQTAQGVR